VGKSTVLEIVLTARRKKWVNYFTKEKRLAAPRIVACRLDSKARLVLPLIVREKLSVSKGDTVLFEVEFSGSQVLLKLSKAREKRLKDFNKTSRNGWEKTRRGDRDECV